MWLVITAGIVLFVGFVAFTGAPYVPSHRKDIVRVFTQLRPLNKHDVVLDIGSGDGIVLREVSKLGARAIGYEIHPLLVLISRMLSWHDARVTVKLANFWRRPLPDDVTVVYTFGESRDIGKMYARVQSEATRLAKEITFISYAFAVPGVRPSKTDNSYMVYQINPS